MPIALWKLILFARDTVMSFIYTDTMLPLFFCIFIKILSTSDWNANDFIAKSVVFEYFHYKMLIEKKMLLVILLCVVVKYTSSSNNIETENISSNSVVSPE